MSSILETEQEQIGKFEGTEGVPMCGANLCSPVVDTAYYCDEIYYKVGGRMWIENADGGGLDGY